MIFLTNTTKFGLIPLFDFKLFKYVIRIMASADNPKNVVRANKRLAKKMGYKNPKILVYNNAKAADGNDISNICWAVYVENKK